MVTPLIEEIRLGLRTSFAGASIPVLSVAGNHDCDFALSNSIRKIVLDSLKGDNIDDDVIAGIPPASSGIILHSPKRSIRLRRERSPRESIGSITKS